MRWIPETFGSKLLVVVGVATIVVAVLLAFEPMNGIGMRGSAVRPHYSAFGWYFYKPLPAHPTTTDLRNAGISVPQDLVSARRDRLGWIAAGGLVTTAVGLALVRVTSRRRPGADNR